MRTSAACQGSSTKTSAASKHDAHSRRFGVAMSLRNVLRLRSCCNTIMTTLPQSQEPSACHNAQRKAAITPVSPAPPSRKADGMVPLPAPQRDWGSQNTLGRLRPAAFGQIAHDPWSVDSRGTPCVPPNQYACRRRIGQGHKRKKCQVRRRLYQQCSYTIRMQLPAATLNSQGK